MSTFNHVVLSQLAFYVNLHRAVIGPSATLTGRWRPDIDLRRMLTGMLLLLHILFMYISMVWVQKVFVLVFSKQHESNKKQKTKDNNKAKRYLYLYLTDQHHSQALLVLPDQRTLQLEFLKILNLMSQRQTRICVVFVIHFHQKKSAIVFP